MDMFISEAGTDLQPFQSAFNMCAKNRRFFKDEKKKKRDILHIGSIPIMGINVPNNKRSVHLEG